MVLIHVSSAFSHTGFAFIYMEDERDAEDAIRGLDRREFGRKGRRLRVEWTKVVYIYFMAFDYVQLFYAVSLELWRKLNFFCLICSSMNVVLEGLVVQEDLQLIQGLQRPCLS